MGAHGPAPKLKVVREREGNPSRRPLPEGIRLPPIPPEEPDWTELLPIDKGLGNAGRARVVRMRKVARARWRLWSRWLSGQGILAPVDVELADACLIVAEIDDCRRQVARQGRLITCRDGHKGNPVVAQLGAARSALQPYLRTFGLTPLARDALNPREGSDEPDGDFD